MLTSFAPSPMASVIFFSLSFINFTTLAFYLGVTLQHITLSQNFAIDTNSSVNSGVFNMTAKASPSTRNDFFFF